MRDYFRNRQVLGSIRQLDVVVPEFFPAIDNLVSYYKLDGNSNDSVGSNNGSDTNITYSLANGKISEGAGFNGSTSKIDLPASYFVAGLSFSISFWYRKNGAPTGNGDVIFSRMNGLTGGFVLHAYQNNPMSIQFRSTSSTPLTGSAKAPSTTYDNNWYHIVYTYNDSDRSNIFYVNGVAGTAQTLSASPTYSAVPLAIGKAIDTYWVPHNGEIDEVGIWSRALTSDEITHLYNSGAGLAYN
jgi:hypothetical protein